MTVQTFTAGQVLTAAQLNTLQASVWTDEANTQTGTSYTLVLTDGGKQITMSNASASTLTVPPNASVAFAIGVRLMVIQLGAGLVTITPGAGVTFNSMSINQIMQQYQVCELIKTATNTWSVNFSVPTTSVPYRYQVGQVTGSSAFTVTFAANRFTFAPMVVSQTKSVGSAVAYDFTNTPTTSGFTIERNVGGSYTSQYIAIQATSGTGAGP